MKREIVVEPTVEEIATVFADLPASHQARFLHEVALVMMSWGPFRRDRQLAELGTTLMSPTNEHARKLVHDLAYEMGMGELR